MFGRMMEEEFSLNSHLNYECKICGRFHGERKCDLVHF
jgi:hypothetical protein